MVYSGIDLPQDYTSYSSIPKSANPSLITVCRLVPHKQIELAIDAVAALESSMPDLELHVVGDGFWLEKLQEHSRRRGVDDRVVFHGFVDSDVKQDLLARSWVMAMPSLKEGWGLTIIEAGLHSTPSVAFRQAGGTQESIQDHVTGLLVNDPEEMIDGLQRLLTDVDYREKLGSNARHFARSFSWQTSGHDLDQIIQAELAAH
nr:glycosyltransferase family 4 protein [Aeromicrobium wangtongii]